MSLYCYLNYPVCKEKLLKVGGSPDAERDSGSESPLNVP